MNLEFAVADLTCEAASKHIFTPHVTLTTVGQTVVRTRRGFQPFGGGTSTLYKRADWTGSITQKAFPNYNDNGNDLVQCGGAKYEFSGTDLIDAHGNILSRHTKNLFVMCSRDIPSLFVAVFNPNDQTAFLVNDSIVGILLGYCWATDPVSCSSCNTDESSWALRGNYAIFGPYDLPSNILWGGVDNPNVMPVGWSFSSTPTVQTYIGSLYYTGALCITPGHATFPTNTGNQVFVQGLPFVRLESTGNWTVTLSDPFTATDENDASQTFINSLAVAENLPNYRSWTNQSVTNISSRITTVTYYLNCSNLVAGSSYRVTARITQLGGATSVLTFTFVATDTTHVISGNLPLPAANSTTKISNPTIAYL